MTGPGPASRRAPAARTGLLIALAIAACGVLIPIVLVAFGADYLAPRNLVAAMVPVTALIAVVVVWPGTGRAGIALAAAIALAFLAISIDVNLSASLQRENWRGLAADLPRSSRERAITTVEFGSAPLKYYLPGLRSLPVGSSVVVDEIVETGHEPVRPSAALAPAPGFHLQARVRLDELVAYRFVSPVARRVSEATLAGHEVTFAHAEALVPAGMPISP
jgi:hypothetical protein